MDTIYIGNAAVIEHDKDHKILCMRWATYIDPEKHSALLHTFLRMADALGIEKLLIDASDSSLEETDNERIDNLVKVIRGTRFLKIARIISRDISSEARLSAFAREELTKIPLRFYSYESDAIDWLRE
jgi:hypothetical protein